MVTIDPVKVDKEIVEEFGLTGILDPKVEAKIGYIDDQITQLQSMLFRTRVDLMLTENLLNSGNELLAQKGNENKAQFRNDLRQTAQAIRTLATFKAHLESQKK